VARRSIHVANLPTFPVNDEHDIQSRIEQELKFCLRLLESGGEAMQRCRIMPGRGHSRVRRSGAVRDWL
jgi:hypothetical protein